VAASVAARADKNALYLIDSSIYVFRGWHTLPGSIVDAQGHPANAVHGFTDFLFQLIKISSGNSPTAKTLYAQRASLHWPAGK